MGWARAAKLAVQMVGQKLGGLRAAAIYEAASTKPRMTSFYAPRIGPNTAIQRGTERMRAESHALMRNDPTIWRAIQHLVADVVGTGITPQSQIRDSELKKAIHQRWTDWSDEASADGKWDVYGIMRIAALGSFVGGEVFLRRRLRRRSDGLTVPLQLQVLEADFCPLEMNETVANGNVIRQGIEFNGIGQRVAYHLYREHPHDTLIGGTSAADLVRVPASEILHLYECTRPGQQRGEPRLARVIVPAYQLGTYRHAMATRMEIGAALTGWFTPKLGDDVLAGALGEPGTGSGTVDAPTPDATGGVAAAMQLGDFRRLDPGEEVKLVDAPEIGTTADAFLYAMERQIAAGIGVTYEAASGDHRGSNFSRSRSAKIDVRALQDAYQWATFIPIICQGIWKWWWEAAILGGSFEEFGIDSRRFAVESRELMRVTWIPPRREWVDPLKDAQAVIKLIEAGLMSRSQAIRELGWDPEALDDERADDAQREKDRTLSSSTQASATDEPPDPDEDETPETPVRRVA